MPPDPAKYLHDIRVAGDRIVEFTAGRTWSEYVADAFFRSAVERQFQILGEALFQLAKTDSETACAITGYRDIIRFRHVLVHGYDKVDDEVVWGVVRTHLPSLMDEINKLLR